PEASEARACLGGGVCTAIVRRRDLDVLSVAAPVRPLVLDAKVRKLHALFEHGQLAFPGPLRDLVACPRRASVAVLPVTIPLLQEALVVALELVVEDDACDARAVGVE